MAQQNSQNAENGSGEQLPVHELPMELQLMIGNRMVLQTLIDLSRRENVAIPMVARGFKPVYETFLRNNRFLIPAVYNAEASQALDDWIEIVLDSRMIKELVYPSVRPHLMVQVAIVADHFSEIGPAEYQNRIGEGAVRIREDSTSIARLFELVRKFKLDTAQALDLRYVLVSRRRVVIDGISETRTTKAVMPEPIKSSVERICERAVYNELIPMLEMTNGTPSAAALTLADNYLPTNGPIPAFAAGAAALIPPDPEVVQLLQAVANDPALKIEHGIRYLRQEVNERIFGIIHTLNNSTYYDNLLLAFDLTSMRSGHTGPEPEIYTSSLSTAGKS